MNNNNILHIIISYNFYRFTIFFQHNDNYLKNKCYVTLKVKDRINYFFKVILIIIYSLKLLLNHCIIFIELYSDKNIKNNTNV